MKAIHLYALSILSGLILSLGWPMYGFPWLLFFGFVPLLFIEDHIQQNFHNFHKYSILKYSYVAFIVWNTLTTWWIWNSTIFGAIMAVLLNSLFMAVVFWLFHLSKKSFYSRSNAIYLLIIFWIAFEYLHLDWDLSWPWLNLGNGFANYTKWVQWYEFTGTLGGTFWILLLNILFFKLIKKILGKTEGSVSILSNSITALLVLTIPMIFSIILFSNYEESGESVEVIISQPNIDPYTEQYNTPVKEVIDKTLGIAEPLITEKTRFLVCPESALQESIWHHVAEESRSVVLIRRFLEKYPQVNIVIGASTFRLFEENEPPTRTARQFADVEKYYDAYNTALFINDSAPVGLYHKSKLVPGPEKMPFQRLLKPLQHLAFDLGGTVGSLGTSAERTVFSSKCGHYHVPAIICYESVYGNFTAEFVRNGANILFIITNDGWWDNTPGHQQHFLFAPLRAIETRRSIARSANTGISAFINQRGDILQTTEYWVPDAIKTTLQANTKFTFYVKHGDYIGRICTFLGIFLLLIALTASVINRDKLKPAK
ncbi:MAG: apolipoprotein N-acyltransferase [Sphingobacteriia bacterium]|nr:apolipoprotein N-acyltransferase [Sphingobacteriia bacterium]